LSRNTRDNKLSYGENPKSLSHLSCIGTRLQWTDEQTDRITVANTRYSYASSRA